MTIDALNKSKKNEAKESLLKCCGSSRWAEKLLQSRPFKDADSLFSLSEKIWFEQCSREDWLEAFSQHPKIGDLESLEEKFAATKNWAGNEQAEVNLASKKVLEKLAVGNEAYFQKFGYIFIVCATRKSAEEMLELLTQRLKNDAEEELKIAMAEQNKITKIRLQKLFSS